MKNNNQKYKNLSLEEIYWEVNDLYLELKSNLSIEDNNQFLDFLEFIENESQAINDGLVSCEKQSRWIQEGIDLLTKFDTKSLIVTKQVYSVKTKNGMKPELGYVCGIFALNSSCGKITHTPTGLLICYLDCKKDKTMKFLQYLANNFKYVNPNKAQLQELKTLVQDYKLKNEIT